MKFHGEYSGKGEEGSLSMPQRMRALAEKLPNEGRSRLRLSRRTAKNLAGQMRKADALARSGIEDTCLDLLRAEGKRISSCLYMAEEGDIRRLPGRGRPRVLALARRLIAGGEREMSLETLMEDVKAFDRINPLTMRELSCMPEALRVALCEAMTETAGEILVRAEAARRAIKWVECGGRLPKACPDAFLEYAARLCAEEERKDKLEEIQEGRRMDLVSERACQEAARSCMRLNNLLGLNLLLEKINWQKCFEEISDVEAALREDEVYAGMDKASQAQLRKAVEDIALDLHMREGTVVRYAGKLARERGTSVCFYLMDDAGRRALQSESGSKGRLKRRIPDPTGRISILILAGSSLILWLFFCRIVNSVILWLPALPLAWVIAGQLVARLYPKIIHPRPLLKMKIEKIPDEARVLVALPVLLGSREAAGRMVERMEALGCLERDKNIDYLLLGDFRDSDSAFQPEDDEILEVARTGIARLNRKAGREKYFYLHRGRCYRAKDEKWTGYNRKRGAIMALNRLILKEEDAAMAFEAENGAAEYIAGRYKYVVTLDSDTEYLPGTVQKLVGTMLHPLNCRYGLIQPCMQANMESNQNAYTDLMYGSGGVDGYPVQVSEFYQDLTGYGCFAGKGIYDVRAFSAATDGILPDGEILSHDLIEGILCGAGFAGDIFFYDALPESLSAELGRRHRWTRGDWQLLRVIFSRLSISPLDRLKMIGNLLRSLQFPALCAIFLGSVWMDIPAAFLLGLAAIYLEAVFKPLDFHGWKRATLNLAVLPALAERMLDAAVRALWRLFVSRKHLMDWVPAADSAKKDAGLRLPGRILAILLLPGLLRPFWTPAVVALALLFWVGMDWADDLAGKKNDARSELGGEEIKLLRGIAEETWRFFAEFVPMDGPGLPPDNVQFDPPAGAAKRTSPTNIGLYMMSCISARELGLLSGEEMLCRLEKTLSTLEKLEKWQGNLYNWYDIDTLLPLKPRYVSSVDSGNLAGALLMCSAAVEGDLGKRMRSLAENMRLNALYDEDRNLFLIGVDVEYGHASNSHYDLYASESRILSYSAMMLGQVPIKHWNRLARPAVQLGRDRAMLSWSGTMFEYLMPELLMRSRDQSLAGQARIAAVRQQIAFGRDKDRPWGISESGHYAFDLHFNYQYHAFGLNSLALSGNTAQDVTAPYASALALCCNPVAATENLKKMRLLGWYGTYGMYEAADYRGREEPKLVKSCMAHHQGMILCAICNALKGDVLSELFMKNPEARALNLLLQERTAPRPILPGRRKNPRRETIQKRTESSLRRSMRKDRAADVHLLYGGGTGALATARGAIFVRRGQLLLNRCSGNLSNPHEGAFVHLEDLRNGEKTVFGASCRGEFDVGLACWRENLGDVQAKLTICVSPEDGSVFQQVTIQNHGREDRQLSVSGCMAVALARDADMRAHAVFQNLFVESRIKDGALLFHRRPRDGEEEFPEMMYLCSEDAEYETDLEKLTGRMGSLGLPGGIAEAFSGALGDVINPCAALRCKIRLRAGEEKKIHFAMAISEKCEEKIEQLRDVASAGRAMQLSCAHARAMLRHSLLDEGLYRLAQRALALILDARLRPQLMECRAEVPVSRQMLWQAGISGDYPILLAEIHGDMEKDFLRNLIRLHGFYRLMGMETDLVLVEEGGGAYLRPEADEAERLISASHLRDLRGMPGGVFLLKREQPGVDALRRIAAMKFSSRENLSAQLRTLLEDMNLRNIDPWQEMQPEAQNLPTGLAFSNGYGGFDGEEYVIRVSADSLPPAPWCNVLAEEDAGAVISERGGGFAWAGNSRSGRITPFYNDALREGWGWMFYLLDEKERAWTRMLPGDVPMTDFLLRLRPNMCRWEAACEGVKFLLEAVPADGGVSFALEVENTGKETKEWKIVGMADWLLGVDALDTACLRDWSAHGACFAAGSSGVGCFGADDPRAEAGCDRNIFLNGGSMMQPRGFDFLESGRSGWTLQLPLRLKNGERKRVRFMLVSARNADEAMLLLRKFRSGKTAQQCEKLLRVDTPDPALNALVNGFLPAQVKNARILGRTGFYQPGGAYGFRDQLQDMLPLIYTEPERVRKHILRCAGRQFPSGDVLHWWHEPRTGVRTKISDDLLFLPYVTAKYVGVTEDSGILEEQIPFLKEIEIPDGREDIYAAMEVSEESASLHDHCMRAFRRAERTGVHGLCLMGCGDWNDGMNRVGAEGRGESIWLTEFAATCAAEYARLLPEGEEKTWLKEFSRRLCEAIEKNGWDGRWYLRAYGDGGEILGGRENRCCRIDAISQAWAVFAGLEASRCASAMDETWKQLADDKLKLIRLLHPPFDGEGFDPGYIAAYPPGVRENGAQYTHAACWLALAYARMGDGWRAHRALEMLLPVNHSASRKDAERYRVEPYVMAADVYTNEKHAGRGGWTWYTGSAAWMLMLVYEILGFERRGNKVRMNALLGNWERAAITLRCGKSSYELLTLADAKEATLDGKPLHTFVELVDDGKRHRAIFPPRRSLTCSNETNE